MSFWGRIFGTEKALNAVVNGVSNGLDALIYTDEERAQGAALDRTEARKMVVQWMTATQGQNLARRLIALSITAVWLIQHLIGQGLSVAAAFVDDSDKLVQAASVVQSGANEMNGPVMLILTFYFSAPFMGDIAKTVLSKRNSGAVG